MRFFILFCSLQCVQAQFGVTTDQLFFRTTTIGSITFEKDKIEEFLNPRFQFKTSSFFWKSWILKIALDFRSIVECAIRCTQTSHCSRFLDDGNKCHLLQRPTFLQEVHENDSLLRVQEIQGKFLRKRKISKKNTALVLAHKTNRISIWRTIYYMYVSHALMSHSWDSFTETLEKMQIIK